MLSVHILLPIMHYAQKNIASTDPSFYTDDELEYFKTHSYNWVDDTWR